MQRARDGVGLSNTRARLEHLYPGRHAFTVPATAVAPEEDLAEALDISA